MGPTRSSTAVGPSGQTEVRPRSGVRSSAEGDCAWLTHHAGVGTGVAVDAVMNVARAVGMPTSRLWLRSRELRDSDGEGRFGGRQGNQASALPWRTRAYGAVARPPDRADALAPTVC